MQIQGLVLGLLLGTAVNSLAYGWIGHATNWQDEAGRAAIRAEVKFELSHLDQPADSEHDVEAGHASEGDDDEAASLLPQHDDKIEREQDAVRKDTAIDVSHIHAAHGESA